MIPLVIIFVTKCVSYTHFQPKIYIISYNRINLFKLIVTCTINQLRFLVRPLRPFIKWPQDIH